MASSRGGKDYDYLFKVLFIGDAGVVRSRLTELATSLAP